MERYLKSCSESVARCNSCRVKLVDDKEGNKELRELHKQGYFLKLSEQMECPKCGLSFSKDNPWIYFSAEKFMRKYRKEHRRPSLLERIFNFLNILD